MHVSALLHAQDVEDVLAGQGRHGGQPRLRLEHGEAKVIACSLQVLCHDAVHRPVPQAPLPALAERGARHHALALQLGQHLHTQLRLAPRTGRQGPC